jgi:hypothetical protein
MASARGANGKRQQRAVGQRNPDCFALAAIEFSASPPSTMYARGLEFVLAELPSDHANGATIKSPFFTVLTAEPTASTTP